MTQNQKRVPWGEGRVHDLSWWPPVWLFNVPHGKTCLFPL